MVKITIRFTNDTRDYIIFLDSIFYKKDKIYGIKNNNEYFLAQTFYNQIVPNQNTVTYNSIYVSNELKQLLQVPEDLETNEAWTFKIETL